MTFTGKPPGKVEKPIMVLYGRVAIVARVKTLERDVTFGGRYPTRNTKTQRHSYIIHDVRKTLLK